MHFQVHFLVSNCSQISHKDHKEKFSTISVCFTLPFIFYDFVFCSCLAAGFLGHIWCMIQPVIYLGKMVSSYKLCMMLHALGRATLKMSRSELFEKSNSSFWRLFFLFHRKTVFNSLKGFISSNCFKNHFERERFFPATA